jgi:nicotinate-nucleotide adenylyltransferase
MTGDWKQRIGVYSGTFDPIHAGHIAFADATQKVCALDRVIFLPEKQPREKQHVSDIAERLALLDQATEPYKNLHVQQLESAQFSVQHTLPELRRLLGDANFTLLVGSDVVRTFLYRWEGLATLLAEVSLAIGMRAGDSQGEMLKIIHELEQTYKIPTTYTFIVAPHADLASSHFRKVR